MNQMSRSTAGPLSDWVREVITTLQASVTLLPRTTAFGWYPGNMIGLAERVTDHLSEPPTTAPRERLWQVRAGRVLLAAGAIERPLVFPGNDRPGVMLAGSARCVSPSIWRQGRQPVLSSLPPMTAPTAPPQICMRRASRLLELLISARRRMVQAVDAARALGIPIHAGMTIASTEGRGRVHSAKLANRAGIIPCDTILMSGGWTPTVHLFSQSRAPLDIRSGFGLLPAVQRCSRCLRRGYLTSRRCLRDGTAAGGSDPRPFVVAGIPAMAPSGPPVPAASHRHAFVDFQNDVTTKDLAGRDGRRFRFHRTRQALHDRRHGHRPGQDVQPERSWRQ